VTDSSSDDKSKSDVAWLVSRSTTKAQIPHSARAEKSQYFLFSAFNLCLKKGRPMMAVIQICEGHNGKNDRLWVVPET
jgi:hypothetical protein